MAPSFSWMFAVPHQRELYNGFGNALARSFELIVTPALFTLIGLGLDHWLGVFPVLTIVFAVLAIVGMSIKMYYGYTVAIEAEQAKIFGPRPANPGAGDERQRRS